LNTQILSACIARFVEFNQAVGTRHFELYDQFPHFVGLSVGETVGMLVGVFVGHVSTQVSWFGGIIVAIP
jgi:hypothetical protein